MTGPEGNSQFCFPRISGSVSRDEVEGNIETSRSTVLNDLISIARSAVFGSWEEPPSIWLTIAKNPFVDWALNFRVRMLLKGAVTEHVKPNKGHEL